ncbi:MAG: efflux RND transporter periplasmic adaptor subunit [Hyphomicrobium sp.]
MLVFGRIFRAINCRSARPSACAIDGDPISATIHSSEPEIFSSGLARHMVRILTAYLMALLLAGAALAGPGHDGGHDHDAGPATASTSTPRLESVGSDMELVATSEGHKLVLYLDRTATNEPIDRALIEVSGDGIQTIETKQSAPGTYELEAEWVDTPGTYALIFTVTAGKDADLLNGTWAVASPEANTPIQPVALVDILARRDVWGLIVGGLALGFFLALAIRRRRHPMEDDAPSVEQSELPRPRARPFRAAAEMILLALILSAAITAPGMAGPGHDHGDGGHKAAPTAASGKTPRKLPDGSVYVPKPTQRLLQVRTEPATETTTSRVRELIGTVVPDPSSFGQVQAPMDGQIEVSERGISYAGQKVEAGEVLALLAPSIPVADLGTMQQLRAEVEGKLIIAEQKLNRLSQIASVVARSQIDDTKAELAALREQKRVLAPKDTEKVALKAPVSGVISVANVRAGQVVNARDTLFEIVDPEKLWVEAIGSDTHGEGEIDSAEARDSEGHIFKLTYVGRSPALRQQARPSLFRLVDAHQDLPIGAPLKVLVQTPQSAKGIAVLESAVVRGTNGLPQVWVKQSPERFRPVEVRTMPLDGGRTLVVAGVAPGNRVVIGAAELINQIR